MGMRRGVWAMAMAMTSLGCGDGSGGGDVIPDGDTRVYVLSAMDNPAAIGNTLNGFNLDGTVSAGEGARCDDAPDYMGLYSGEAGVDNQFAQGDVMTLIADGIGVEVAEAVAEGRSMVAFVVQDLDSIEDDASVTVELRRVTLHGGGAPMVDERGALLPDQAFVLGELLTSGAATVVEGWLDVSFDALPLVIPAGEGELLLPLSDARVRVAIGPAALINGTIGGAMAVADLLSMFEGVAPGVVTEDSLRDSLQPDLEPNADGTECAAVSAGLSVSAVSAHVD